MLRKLSVRYPTANGVSVDGAELSIVDYEKLLAELWELMGPKAPANRSE